MLLLTPANADLKSRISAVNSIKIADITDPFESSELKVLETIQSNDIDQWKSLIVSGNTITLKNPTFGGIAGYIVCISNDDIFALSVLRNSGIVMIHQVKNEKGRLFIGAGSAVGIRGIHRKNDLLLNKILNQTNRTE